MIRHNESTSFNFTWCGPLTNSACASLHLNNHHAFQKYNSEFFFLRKFVDWLSHRPRLKRTGTSNGHVQGMFSTLLKVASVCEIKEHVYII